MGTIPLNFGSSSTTQPIVHGLNNGSLDFGNLPFNFAPFGGQNPSGNNGLPLAGSWASGGFNTIGQPPQGGWSPFYGQGTSSSQGTTFGSFGVPQTNFPAFNAPSIFGGSVPFQGQGSTNPGANNSFGFNPQTGLPTIGNPGIGVTSATQGPFPQIDTNQLKKLYGNAVGGALTQFLNSGAGYNPQVVQALINQALPLEARGSAKLQNEFGNIGGAYSSTAALAQGDFESQFNSALSGEMANLYEQSVQNYLGVLTGTLGGAQKQQSEKFSPLSLFSELGGGALAGIQASNSGTDVFGSILAGLGGL